MATNGRIAGIGWAMSSDKNVFDRPKMQLATGIIGLIATLTTGAILHLRGR